ncbi:hypothetical protein CHM34_04135 [Paludifilum halophilum]|uniref:Uncharacterized protein n=1 Tax=Paludifilum halophilum TaxID=1642702 RepID=A0A235B9I3_9BACL|nr:hypothetical protein CHM34_04135 [Paludifilum halophilum]
MSENRQKPDASKQKEMIVEWNHLPYARRGYHGVFMLLLLIFRRRGLWYRMKGDFVSGNEPLMIPM